MPSPALPPSPPGSGLDLSAVLPYLAAVATGLGGWFAALSTAPARLQTTLNAAFRSLTAELQQERAQLIVRVSALEQERDLARARIEQLQGEIRQNQQLIDSLRRSPPGEPSPEETTK